jgi:hypothetical protein
MILKPNGVNTKEYKTDSLTIHYFVDKQSSQYTLFDDDGTDNRSLKLNHFELLNFKANVSNNGLIFKFSTNGGSFTGKPVKRNIRMLVHGLTNPEKYLFINGKKGARLLPVNNSAGQPTDLYYFSIDFTGKPITIDIK